MKKIKRGLLVLTGIVLALGLAGCGKSSAKKQLSTKSVTVGVTGGPHAQIMDQVKKLAAKDGLTIKVKTFTDYNTPNSALSSGDLQANSYQTLPFFKQQVADKNYKFATAFKTVAFPLGVYSHKVKQLSALKKGDSIAVPNDPANETRALRLFQKAGVLKLKAGVGQKATKNDVASNPKHLKIVELDASQLPKQLGEVTAAAINTNFAMSANLTINKDAIYHESLTHNPFPNYFVVQSGHQNDKVIRQIEKYYHSKTIKQYIQTTFKGSVVPAF